MTMELGIVLHNLRYHNLSNPAPAIRAGAPGLISVGSESP